MPAPSGDPDGQGFEIFHDVLAGAVRGWAQRTRAARLERRNARLAAAVATLAAIAVALLVQGASSGALHRLELRTVDERFALRGGHAPDPRILIVGFDDRANERELTRAADAAVLAKVAAGRPAVAVVAFEYDAAGDDGNGGPAETKQLKRAIGDANKLTRVLLGRVASTTRERRRCSARGAARTSVRRREGCLRGTSRWTTTASVRDAIDRGAHQTDRHREARPLGEMGVAAAEKTVTIGVAAGPTPATSRRWIDSRESGGQPPSGAYPDVLERPSSRPARPARPHRRDRRHVVRQPRATTGCARRPAARRA